MSGEVLGKARLPAAMNVDDTKDLPLDPDTGYIPVVLFAGAGGGPLPFAYGKGSGRLTGQAVAVTGYAADEPLTLSTPHIGYLLGQTTGKVRLGINVEAGANNFTVAATTLTLYRKTAGVWAPTAATFTYVAAEDGIKQATFNAAFADGDAWDLQVTNPGNVADVGKFFPFGFSAYFF